MPEDEPEAKWVSYPSHREREQRPAEEIGYAEAADHQQTEFGPLPHPEKDSKRAKRLNRREGYSPTEGDKPRFAAALASTLDLTDTQREDVYSIMGDLDLSAFGSQRRLETVALGVITVVVNYDRLQRHQNRNVIRIAETPEFRDVMARLDIDYSDIGTAKRVAKQELAEQGYFEQRRTS